jgi:hypothetical protein
VNSAVGQAKERAAINVRTCSPVPVTVERFIGPNVRFPENIRMGIRDDKFWADFLGVDPTGWSTIGVSVQSHVGLRGYRGLWCFRRNRRIVVSAPAPWVPRLTEVIVRRVEDDDLMLPTFWAQALQHDFERAIGPAFQGCLDPTRFEHKANSSVRPVDDSDCAAVEQFRAACGPDWNDGGLDKAGLWRHAYFEGGLITAMAGYRAWADDAGDPCVLTRSDVRSGGRGAAVTAAVVARALANGKMLLYQTLESNHPAVRIALSLGYDRYANHLAIRLNREAPEP